VITETLYSDYLMALLAGSKPVCAEIVSTLLDAETPIKRIYLDLFQRSLYEIGTMWERNAISVSTEHLASSITESLLNLIYPKLFMSERRGRKAVIACCAAEHHQIGAKIVADFFEIHGWDSYFLGADTPADALVKMIDLKKPDLVGLSIAIYFNVPSLKTMIEEVKTTFEELPILVGGQAFLHGGRDFLKASPGVEYIDSLESLERDVLS